MVFIKNIYFIKSVNCYHNFNSQITICASWLFGSLVPWLLVFLDFSTEQHGCLQLTYPRPPIRVITVRLLALFTSLITLLLATPPFLAPLLLIVLVTLPCRVSLFWRISLPCRFSLLSRLSLPWRVSVSLPLLFDVVVELLLNVWVAVSGLLISLFPLLLIMNCLLASELFLDILRPTRTAIFSSLPEEVYRLEERESTDQLDKSRDLEINKCVNF